MRKHPKPNTMDYFNERIIKELSSKIIAQQEEILRQKLIEKGFGNLIEGMKNRRFPKITRIDTVDAKYYYADNNSPNGVFIIGFTKPEMSPIDYFSDNTSITMTFNPITVEPLSLMIF
jgi:hypothetical protein